MNKLLFGGAALLGSAAAVAQVAPAPQAKAAKVHTLADVQAKVTEHFAKLDTNRDGYLSLDEVRHIRDYDKAFAEADKNGDGRLDSGESIMAHSLHERALAARVAADSLITAKVKTAIFQEPTLKSAEINVETFKGVVQLSGFVDTPQMAERAGTVAKQVNGVDSVKNDLIVK